ncbi:unnamed protein product [Ceutorhynchus assimilis]|uniref:Uncharacterized protein n=1 Tax=Ceutorhynchus assimilis TaxID=467358 RepID=A0A9N9MX89_9CUCU|nr:unnamed protein product [Ceutorhynchus assimilis]
MALKTHAEIDSFVVGDNTIELIGYVDEINGSKQVKNNTKTLFKFILNNGQGRRIRILMWDEMAKKFEQTIVNKQGEEHSKHSNVVDTFFELDTTDATRRQIEPCDQKHKKIIELEIL